MSIIGNPNLKNCANVILNPYCSATPTATTLALAPMIVPFPPRHVPKTNAHTRGVRGKPSPPSASWTTTGTNVAVYGILLSKNK